MRDSFYEWGIVIAAAVVGVAVAIAVFDGYLARAIAVVVISTGLAAAGHRWFKSREP